jgi:chemotaxis family two-component system sensor kinase Cph1
MIHSAIPTNASSMPASQPYSIKRHGLTLANCDSEPVQTPGCVQAHGALLVLRRADLTVLQASENSQALLGHAPEALLGPDGEARLRAFLAAEPLDRNPLYFLTLPARELVSPLDVTVHTIDGVVVLEFEATGQTDGGEPDYYALVKKTVNQLQMADTLRQFCDIAAEEVRALTGMDRVMVYQCFRRASVSTSTRGWACTIRLRTFPGRRATCSPKSGCARRRMWTALWPN